jgi:hypothetical protein
MGGAKFFVHAVLRSGRVVLSPPFSSRGEADVVAASLRGELDGESAVFEWVRLGDEWVRVELVESVRVSRGRE